MEFNALFERRAHFLLLGGHLGLCPAVEDMDLARASAQCRARGIHRGAAAADHRHVSADASSLGPRLYSLRKVVAGMTPRKLLARNTQALAALRADRQQHRVELGLAARSSVMSRPIAVLRRNSTPSARIASMSRFSSARGSRYSGMPMAIMPPATGMASMTVTR